MGKKGQEVKSNSIPSSPRNVEQTRPAASLLASDGEKFFAQACTLHQQGNAEGALENYQRAVQIDPGLSGAWRNLGALLRQQGEIAKSRHCTEQALKLDDTDGCLWGNYGNVLRDQDQLEESCQAFREGLKRAPQSKGLLQGLAISFGRLGEHQKVIELLTPIVDRSLNIATR